MRHTSVSQRLYVIADSTPERRTATARTARGIGLRRGRGVDFDGWLTWECDSWSRAEHVAFEAIDTCIVWLT